MLSFLLTIVKLMALLERYPDDLFNIDNPQVSQIY